MSQHEVGNREEHKSAQHDDHAKPKDVSHQAHELARAAYKNGGGTPGGVAALIGIYGEPMLSEIMFHIQREHGNHFAAKVERELKKMSGPVADADGLLTPDWGAKPAAPTGGGGPDGLLTPNFD